MKDGEGISQSIFMHDPWTQTMIWGLLGGGVRWGLVEVGKGREIGDKCKSLNNKKLFMNKNTLKL